MEDENSSLQLCVPRIVTLQSPLRKAFRLTDTVGKCLDPFPAKLTPLWPGAQGCNPGSYHQVAAEAYDDCGEGRPHPRSSRNSVWEACRRGL